ncbi:hypothetical protein Y5W_02512 [Alcanivorax sp. 521-1]|uniref:Uncharacterized protein n=1 Tax=Alloalcanivorax profundimaris TaxID=2735259 RepID=A0ABS0ASX2_9GAMM|nr:hypothetical protein [Alloalcanivorax profundimaris]MBF5057218.1 hypothetical protein [Alloalcanivorax profundimaris]
MAHIDWDDPGAQSVTAYYRNDPNIDPQPHAGSVLSARYRGRVVRVTVDAYDRKAGISHGKVAAIMDADSGKRLDQHAGLSVGDPVALPDDKRAFEPAVKDDDEQEDGAGRA